MPAIDALEVKHEGRVALCKRDIFKHIHAGSAFGVEVAGNQTSFEILWRPGLLIVKPERERAGKRKSIERKTRLLLRRDEQVFLYSAVKLHITISNIKDCAAVQARVTQVAASQAGCHRALTRSDRPSSDQPGLAQHR